MSGDALLRCQASEGEFYRLCEEYKREGKFPECISDVERPTAQEESKGADAFLKSAEGDRFPVNVKNSLVGAKKYHNKKNRRHVTCVVISPGNPENKENFEKMLRNIERKRLYLLQARETGDFSKCRHLSRI